MKKHTRRQKGGWWPFSGKQNPGEETKSWFSWPSFTSAPQPASGTPAQIPPSDTGSDPNATKTTGGRRKQRKSRKLRK